MPAQTISNRDDVIDIRDVIARFEELEETDDVEEREPLEALLEQCKGQGGDEQWRGDWYPVTLIRDSYFRDYAEELADDVGAINSEARWPNNCIDWDRAARELQLQLDYTTVEFDGVTYWTR